MSHTVTVCLPRDLAEWLEETAAKSGVSQGQLIREQLAQAKNRAGGQPFLRLAGAVRGAPDLSARKGFSKS